MTHCVYVIVAGTYKWLFCVMYVIVVGTHKWPTLCRVCHSGRNTQMAHFVSCMS